MTDADVTDKFLERCRGLFEIRGITGVTLDSRLVEDLDASSMIYMGLAGIIGELFGKQVDYTDVKQCKTLADVLALGRS